MAGKRKNYSADFKARVALEAIRGEATIAELVAKHGVHQTVIHSWKRQALEGMAAIFSGKAEAKAAEKEGEIESEPCRAIGSSGKGERMPRSANWWWSEIF